jgi:hypothetical protein
MPDINSPLGRRAIATATRPILNVPNEEGHLEDESEEITREQEIEELQAARKARIANSKKINPGSKERVEILLNLGRITDSIKFEGIEFSLQSLKSSEIREVVKLSNQCTDAADSYFEARLQTLARSIYAIDKVPISLVIGSSKLEDIIVWVDNMDETIIEFIHNFYLKMMNKHKSKFSIKDEEDAKGVAEEIKK